MILVDTYYLLPQTKMLSSFQSLQTRLCEVLSQEICQSPRLLPVTK
jgi:hypothetical protein